MLQVTRRPENTAKTAGSETITVNLGQVCPGQIDRDPVDLLVGEGTHGNRSDFVRTAIRNQIERQAELTRPSMLRRSVERGPRRYRRANPEVVRSAGHSLDIRVLERACNGPDVAPELARETIASREMLGGLQASPEVKAALADRLR